MRSSRGAIAWFSVTGLLFGAGAVAAQGWVPTDCAGRLAEIRQLRARAEIRGDLAADWQRRAEAIRTALPGGDLYVPRPFPKTREEILEDFRHTYFDKLFAAEAGNQIPADELPIYKAQKEQAIEIEIVRVTNWRLSRCTGPLPEPYFHLLRLRDRRTGREVARYTMADTGIMGIYGHVTPLAEEALPGLATLETTLRARLGRTLPVEAPQYVAADGLPYHCDEKLPCVAFRSAGKIYLLDRGELLYEIDPAAPRVSVSELRSRSIAAPRALGAHEIEAPLVSLGFEWAQAQLVARRAAR